VLVVRGAVVVVGGGGGSTVVVVVVAFDGLVVVLVVLHAEGKPLVEQAAARTATRTTTPTRSLSIIATASSVRSFRWRCQCCR
jgi:hypothetical protein